MRTGRIGKVSLQTENADRTGSRFESVFKVGNIHAVYFQRRAVFLATLKVQTVVLTGISGTGCSLNPEADIPGYEVIFFPVGTVEIDIRCHFKFLIVRLIHKVHIPHNAHHRLTLLPQLVDIHIGTFIIHHVITGEENNHFVTCRTVDHKVREALIIGQCPVIYAEVSQFHVGTVTRHFDG